MRFVRIKGPPREIALGFALGLFVGMSPTMGIQMAIAVFLASLFRWNLIAAATGVWISNPLTAPFLYGTTYVIGRSIIEILHGPIRPLPPEAQMTLLILIRKTPNVLVAMTVGGVILGIPVAVAGYYFSLNAILQYRKRLKERLSGRIHGALDKVIPQKIRRKQGDDSSGTSHQGDESKPGQDE